jgi:hypothetical protein
MSSTMKSGAVRKFPTIKAVKTFVTQGPGSGGVSRNFKIVFRDLLIPYVGLPQRERYKSPAKGQNKHNLTYLGGHWLIDSKISTPMSQYEQYRKSRTSWGINVLGSFCVELEATDGSKGFATGFGGPPACWLVAEHFERFLIGQGQSLLTMILMLY